MKKLGLKIILVTIALLVLSGYFPNVGFQFKLTAGVFLIGTGVFLMFLGSLTKFNDFDS
jgi:hypothetical protein